MKKTKVKKPIYKRVWFWLIVLFVIGIVGTGNNNSTSQPKPSSVKESTAPSVTVEPIREYDILQKMFINLTFDTSVEDIEKAIEMNKLVHTQKEYKGSDANEYTIGYDKSGPIRNPIKGDHLEVVFSMKDGALKYAVYTKRFVSAILYNYGTYWDLRGEKPDSSKSGYYGDIIGKHNYVRVTSAKEAIQYVLDNQSE